MFKSMHLGRVGTSLALLALAVVALGLATAASGSPAHTSERFVVRGEDTVKDGGACPAGVCQLEIADGAFRGTPVGSGHTREPPSSRSPRRSRTARAASARRSARASCWVSERPTGSSSRSGATPARTAPETSTASSFTNVARFVIKYGTGTYAKASGSGLATFSEDASDVEHMTLIGRISR